METLAKIYDDLLALFSIGTTITPKDAVINMIFSAVFSFLAYYVYVKFGKSTNNRKHFANTFLLITVCTTLIISIVRSSVTLSLGLVGALSIVRFRTAIKDPEELTHLFLCIAIGLGFGANERLVTAVGGVFLLLVLVIRSKLTKSITQEYYNLSIRTSQLTINDIIIRVEPFCKHLNLRRFDDEDKYLQTLFHVDVTDHGQLQKIIDSIKEKDSEAGISFVENKSY